MKNKSKNRDGGYGWIIVAAFFLILVIVDGLRFSFGLYFVQFLDEFGEGKGKTAWVGSITIATFNLGGPLIAVIVHKLGYRKSSFVGSIIATIGNITSYFAPNLPFLYLTYGIITGFGYGLLYISGTVAIGRYFQERRSLAMGIAFCGGGFGSFVITPFVSYLIKLYSWRGSLLVLGGLSLNCCVLSAFYRPFNDDKDEFEIDMIANEDKIDNGLTDSCYAIKHELCRNGELSETTLTPILPRTFNEKRKEQLHTDHSNAQGSQRSLTLSQTSQRSLYKSMISQSALGSNASFGHMFDQRNKVKTSKTSVIQIGLSKSDRTRAEDNKTMFSNTIIEGMFPKALMLNINFVILMTACFCGGLSGFVPINMLPDYARFTGSNLSQSAWLLSTMGIGSTISRFVSGYLTGLPCVHRLTLQAVCLLILGITTIIVALVPVYEVLITYSTLYGVFFGAMYVIQPVVFLEHVAGDYMGEVMGLMLFCYGTSAIIGSPMAGWIFDITQSYMTSFLVAGIFFLMATGITLSVLCTKTSRQTRRQDTPKLELIEVDLELS